MPLRTRVVIGASMQYQYDVFGRLYVLSYVTDEQQKKVPKKSDLVLSVMKESLQAGCAGPPWLCARLLSVEGYWEATSSRARMRVHDRAACRRQPLHDNVVKAVTVKHFVLSTTRKLWEQLVHKVFFFFLKAKLAEAGCRSAIRLVRGHRQDVVRSTM